MLYFKYAEVFEVSTLLPHLERRPTAPVQGRGGGSRKVSPVGSATEIVRKSCVDDWCLQAWGI